MRRWHVLAQLFQRGIQIAAVFGPDASRKQNAVHAATDQFADKFRGDGLVFHGLEKTDAASVLISFPVGRIQNPVEIEVGYDRENHGQGAAAAAFEILRGDTGRVGMGIDDLLNLQPGCFLYMRIMADDTGNRSRGDSRLPRDIVNRGFSVHSILLRSSARCRF